MVDGIDRPGFGFDLGERCARACVCVCVCVCVRGVRKGGEIAIAISEHTSNTETNITLLLLRQINIEDDITNVATPMQRRTQNGIGGLGTEVDRAPLVLAAASPLHPRRTQARLPPRRWSPPPHHVPLAAIQHQLSPCGMGLTDDPT